MVPNQPPQNGQQKLAQMLPPKPSLTPDERRIWLASHNAPRDMMLISIPEFAGLSAQLTRQQVTIHGLSRLLASVERNFGEAHKFFTESAQDAQFDPQDEKEAEIKQAVETHLAAMAQSLALIRQVLPKSPPAPNGKEHG